MGYSGEMKSKKIQTLYPSSWCKIDSSNFAKFPLKKNSTNNFNLQYMHSVDK